MINPKCKSYVTIKSYKLASIAKSLTVPRYSTAKFLLSLPFDQAGIKPRH